MTKRRAAVGLAAALLAAAGAARAGEICPTAGEAASGPLAGGDGPADFGTIPEACLASDVTLRARGALLVAASKPDFFGSILAGAMLRARRPIGTKSWLTLALDVVDFRYINNGGLAATGLSFGPATLGYNRTVYATDGSTTAGYARLLLPIDTARQNGFETGLEVGGVVRARLGGRAIADGGVGLDRAPRRHGGPAPRPARAHPAGRASGSRSGPGPRSGPARRRRSSWRRRPSSSPPSRG